MDDNIFVEKEVYFGIYCPMCKYHDRTDQEPPCCDCITHPSNINSHKPVLFEDKYDLQQRLDKIKKEINTK